MQLCVFNPPPLLAAQAGGFVSFPLGHGLRKLRYHRAKWFTLSDGSDVESANRESAPENESIIGSKLLHGVPPEITIDSTWAGPRGSYSEHMACVADWATPMLLSCLPMRSILQVVWCFHSNGCVCANVFVSLLIFC
jgi:hypothetical protein